MKHTMRILTFLMLAVVVGTGQTWGKLRDLGHIVCNEANVTGGTLTFYTDAACTDTKAITMTDGKSSNLSSEDLTAVMDGDNVIGYTVYIKAVPNYDYTLGAADDNGAVTFITAEKTTNVFQAPRRTQSDPTLNLGPDITVTATSERFVYSFVMPASGANVTIHVNFPERAKQSVKYIDVDGELKDSPEAYFIDGSETALCVPGVETSWYVVPAGSVSYACNLPCVGNVNLIIADGATMTIGSSTAPVTGNGLYNNEGSISIYGQSEKTNKLTVYAETHGIYAGSDVTISSCEVTAEGYNGIYAKTGNLTIKGGKVTATATGENGNGLYAGGNINIEWTDETTDFITATSYNGTIVVADGQHFRAVSGENTIGFISGTLDKDDEDDPDLIISLAGTTLVPFETTGYVVTTVDADLTAGTDPDYTNGHTKFYVYDKDATVTVDYTGEGIVKVYGLDADKFSAARTFTMPAVDVVLTATAVTGLTATSVAYDGTAQTPEIKQGDDVFDAANYTIAYQLGEEAVTAADVKNVNTYTCTLTGLGQYVGTTTVPFAITKRTTSLAVEIVNSETTVDGNPVLIAGDDAHVKVTLVPVKGENETTELPAMNGIVTISVDNGTYYPKSYNVAIVNGVGHFYVTNLAQDAYAITASFAGDANHAASTSDPNYSIAVSRVKTALRICFDETDMTANTKVVTVGEPVTVYVDLYTVPSDWDGDFAKASPFNSDAVVTVTARLSWKTDYNDHYTLGLVDGHGSITFSHLPADKCHYNIFAAYAGNDNYQDYLTTDDIGGTLKLTVNKTATTVGVEVTSPVIAK